MPLVSTGSIVAEARGSGRGVCAFNVITLEHAEAILAGAGAPVILQISENAVRFHDGRLRPLAAGVAALAEDSPVAASLHLDHVTDADLLRRAPDCGFSSAMFDASALPYDENVKATREAADWAHARGLWLEAELGEVGGKDGAHAPGVRTDPAEAAAFVAETGVDALAVAVGSSHAMTSRTASLDLSLITALRDALPVPLVLHGSSGVPDEALAAAVAAGMTKINIGTALNIAFTGAVRETLAGSASLVDPRKYLAPARAAMAGVVRHLVETVSQRP
ncbi:class II fructose-bisphosphate aldolase [Bailinhaonella thermotolerans]|uniref:Class II fructose-bisphosphate aldolase n=1 Tax=Bailinhaonella thermotolerans TaxID=1070861 RepID=A0A3A4AZ02_9ACTN|nr:class II fructose-bisphosphate aldolase [Bailinhaonella thermotolerans]RJL34353.1 class II fructose-bisphosphate aldolase [Bailinhaonella thermotolerans]